MRFHLIVLLIVSCIMLIFFCINNVIFEDLNGILIGVSLTSTIIFMVYIRYFLKKNKY